MEGSPPDRPDDRNLLRYVASHYGGGADDPVSEIGVQIGVQHVATLTLPEVVMAILDSRANYPVAASAALIRERDGEGVVVHLVLLDGKQEPLFAAPGVIIAVTYAVQHLGSDVVAAFGDRKVIILR